MSGPQRIEFIRNLDLQDWQKNELLQAPDPQELYTIFANRKRYNTAVTAGQDCYRFFKHNAIFMPRKVLAPYEKLTELIWNALTEHEVNLDHSPVPRLTDRTAEFMREGESLLNEIESIIREVFASD